MTTIREAAAMTPTWDHLYAIAHGYGWEDMLDSTTGDLGEVPRLLAEDPAEREARDHDEGYGCALGHEDCCGREWLVCYAHDVAPVEILDTAYYE